MSDKEKIAPVQGWPQGIPWSLHLEAYAAYCKKWGAQEALIDLPGRNCRGGFHVNELDDFIPGWRDRVSEIATLRAENAKLRAQVEMTGHVILPKAFTSCVMVHEDPKAYCLMAAFKTKDDAMAALELITEVHA